MKYVNTVLSLSRKYIVKPYGLDDICYSIYSIFKDRALSIAYEKPYCSHMFIVGSSYEVRLFINSLREARLSILFDVGSTPLAQSIKHAHNLFIDIDRILSKFCETGSNINVVLRTTLRFKRVSIDVVEGVLKSLGIVVYSKELHSVSDITISIAKGKVIGKNLKRYEVIITLLEDDVSEVSVSVETDLEEKEPVSQLIEVQSILYSLVEGMFLGDNQLKTPSYS